MDLQAQLQAHLGTAYVVERELGGGGMSRVFLAREVRLDRRVAVKVLSPELAAGINARRFEREILLAASLQQANIVPVLAAGEVDGLPYFTMPFVEGESLRQRLGEDPLPIADVVAILRDVTKALAYAHARGIVHRDIKPDNVLLSGGTAVVTDFGIAKAVSVSRSAGGGGTLTQLGTSIGTPAYMAPEQVAGDPNVDHRVDLYALGCLAHELLTGRPPFADRTPQQVLAAHLSETAPRVATLRADCPPALTTLVEHLLRKEPADRTQTAAEVLRELDSAVTPSSVAPALQGPGALARVLGLYALATGATALLAKAAMVGIGLPDWVLPGSVGVMLLGLPALLATAYVKRVARRAVTATPTLTPGGSVVPRRKSGTIATLALKAHPHVSWRRTVHGGVYAMGAFILMIVAYMTLRALGIGPWGSLFAAGSLAENSRIVLADFSAAPDDSALAPIVREAVRAALSQSTSIHVMDPVEVAPVLQEMRRGRNVALDAGTAREVASRAGAAAVLAGRLARAGAGYAVSLDLTSAADGKTLASYQGTAGGAKDLLSVVDELARRLRARVGESLRTVQRTVPLAQATTASLDALRKYSEAAQANDVDLDFDRAVRLAREAVALDSTFALAWRKLAVALVNARGPRPAIDSALEQSALYAGRLPEREKDLILGYFYEEDRARADRGKALAAYQAAYAADSSSTIAMNELARLYGQRRQYDSAVHYFRRQFLVEPTIRNAAALSRILAIAASPDAAAALLDSVVGRSPKAAATLAILGPRMFIYRARGDLDSAARAATLLSASPSGLNQLAGRSALALLAQQAGQLARAATLNRESDSMLARRGGAREIGGLDDAMQDIIFRQRVAEGVRRLDAVTAGAQWAAAGPFYRPYADVVAWYAQAGRPDQARRMLARYQAEDPAGFAAPNNQYRVAEVRGEIALAEGKTAEAIGDFRAANVLEDGAPRTCAACTAFDLARAFERAGRLDSAVAEYEAYLAEPAVQRPDPSDLAAVHNRLGALYEQTGDRAKAVAQYAAFVEQWKNADPDLQPLVAAVRRRLAQLRTALGS